MRTFFNRKQFVVILALSLMLLLVACGGDNNDADTSGDPPANVGADGSHTLSADTEGEITILLWGGSGELLRDVGRVYIPAEDIRARAEAGFIASARAFNEIFPNIVVNVYGREGGPDDNDIPWQQYRANFALDHGISPDIFQISNMIVDIEGGHVGDLSIFRDDPRFQTFNPTLMELTSLEGRTFAVPFGVTPWGIFVNRGLAEAQNIDVPSINWTMEEYFRFISNSNPGEWYGAHDPPFRLGRTGTPDFHEQLANRTGDEPFVTINNESTRNLFRAVPNIVPHTVWPQWNAGNLDQEWMDEHGWWSFYFFTQGSMLTYDHEAWMMHYIASENPPEWARMTLTDWDIFPRPSTPYVDNHIEILVDIIGLRNFAMDDGDANLSPEEFHQKNIAWEFLAFYMTDTRAWQARADQQFNTGDGMGVALNQFFPVSTGQAFQDQMDIWFSADRQLFSNRNAMPGFHRVLELYEAGSFAAFADMAHVWWYEFEGERRHIMFEWYNIGTEDVAGAEVWEPAWLDNVLARLPGWETEMNQRFRDGTESVITAIERFYPEQDWGGR